MHELRQEYTKHALLETEVDPSPFVQFDRWFQEALSGGVMEPNACILSTRAQNGVDSRTILLKGLENEQFIFYTNYLSHKGRQLAQDPACSLCFLWLNVERQVVIRGTAAKVSAEVSDAYFHSRPRGSRIGAWVSSQSSPVRNREALDAKLAETEALYEGREVPRPEHWGGFAIDAFEVEFWQGRANRLHDRILYRKNGDRWEIQRLQP